MRYVVMSILTAGVMLAATAASAQTFAPGYPVCMVVYIDGGSIACSFTSMAQCAASASGRGATCYVNPNAAPGWPVSPPPPRYQRRS